MKMQCYVTKAVKVVTYFDGSSRKHSKGSVQKISTRIKNMNLLDSEEK